MIKTKWFIYTVLIGLIPFFIRAFFYITMKNTQSGYVFNAVDMVTFGLILQLSNINELEGKKDLDEKWQARNIGISLFCVVLFAAFLAISYFQDFDKNKIFDEDKIKILAGTLSITSFILSYSIYNKLNSNHNG